jgi:threonine dehydrogenase-like Zn-dependent dehydrogenase
MRGSVLRGGCMVYLDDLPEPVPGPGQVLLDIKASGICGSDLHFAKGEVDVAPMITGEVGLDAVGEAFDELSDPDRHCKILVEPNL